MDKESTAKTISTILSPEISILIVLTLILLAEGMGSLISYLISVVLLCVVQRLSKTKLFMKDESREERKTAYAIVIVSYVICTITLSLIDQGSSLFFTSMSLTIGSIVMGIANHFTKISVHCGSVTLSATTIGIVFWPVGCIALLSIPLVAWSRITLGKHTVAQMASGIAVGLVIPILIHILL